MIEERDENRYANIVTDNVEPIVDNGGSIADFGADGLTETVADLDNYAKEDRKKIVYGSLFFLIVVLIHIGVGLFVDFDNIVYQILASQLTIVIPALIYMSLFKINPFKFMRFKKFHFGSALLIPLFMYSILPVMGLINLISQLFSTNVIQGTVTDILVGGLGSSLLLVAMLPAFVEETAFRGAIYGSLRGCRPVRAIILSGVMFGALHMNFNQFMYATALGIVMGLLLEATGSILSTMILHFCFNANSVILLWGMPRIFEYMEKITGQNYNSSDILSQSTSLDTRQLLIYIAVFIPVAAIGAAFAYLFYYIIAKLNKRWYYIKFLFSKETKLQRSSFPKPKLMNAFAVIGLIVCFGMCLLNELIVRGIIHR
ncbi:MAG: CPBP family intramembrane metalloprotease [Lachnospiraceae bacterium]|nr:CPBP family intramembrane metalloprotease [Lachnospiraceae bacterium]